MKILLIIASVLLVLAVLLVPRLLYTVDETEQAIVLQFGEPIGGAIRTAGIKFKTPVQAVTYFDKRVLSSDALPQEYLTTDKKRLVVDTVTRWQIVDPLTFFQSVGTESGARSRLDDIVFSVLREELALVDFVDVISGERENIMDRVRDSSAEKALDFGIVVLDVRVKRADLPEAVERNVFNRMQTERQRESALFRAEGDEEARKITSAADVTVAQALAEANRQSRQIRGQAEAQAIKALAEALQVDAEFYSFIRSLETYEKALDTGTTLVLSSGSEFFQFLTDSSGKNRDEDEATR